jgi:23S rRNA pseudouridine2605 synthase
MNIPTLRLNKYLASQGIGARRKIEDFLKDNQVLLNGKRVTEPGIRLNPETDILTINGKLQQKQSNFVYFLLNKPKGIISSVKDEHQRKTVVELIKTKERIYPVGRLDENTQGLIILTNDGELTHKLTHPCFESSKTYHCLIPGTVNEIQLKRLREGIQLKEGKTAPAEAKIIESRPNRTVLELIIHEGRNHQIKRMLNKVGLELLELTRVAIGTLKIVGLPSGSYRQLTPSEVEVLKKPHN